METEPPGSWPSATEDATEAHKEGDEIEVTDEIVTEEEIVDEEPTICTNISEPSEEAEHHEATRLPGDIIEQYVHSLLAMGPGLKQSLGHDLNRLQSNLYHLGSCISRIQKPLLRSVCWTEPGIVRRKLHSSMPTTFHNVRHFLSTMPR